MVAVRVSDPEREAVVARLGAAAAEGRLTLAEFEERCGLAYGATASSDLDRLIVDLPPARGGARVDLDVTVALIGGLVWVPLFPSVDLAAFLGVIGVVFGVRAVHAHPRGLMRALGMLGLLAGAAGVALQLVWFAFMAVG